MEAITVKIITILSLILTIVVLPSIGQPIKEDSYLYKHYDLSLFKNNVIRIEVESYYKRNNKISNRKFGNKIYNIDITEKNIYASDNYSWEEKKYNENNLLVYHHTNYYKTYYFYNDKNKLKEKQIFGKDGYLKKRLKYKYKQNGNINRILYYDENDSLIKRMLYYYKNDSLKKSIIKPVSKSNSDYKQYNYDMNGNIIEIIKNNTIIRKYYYNELGQKIKGENYFFGNGELINTDEFLYNDKGLIKKHVHNEDEESIFTYYYKYYYDNW